MKKTLYPKLLGGYLLFGLLGFLIIATFTYHLTFQHLEKKEVQNLYRESSLISSNYAQNYFSHAMSLDDVNTQLSTLSTYLNADIWIMDLNGNVIVDTGSSSDEPRKVTDFDVADFGSSYYESGTFYDCFYMKTRCYTVC